MPASSEAKAAARWRQEMTAAYLTDAVAAREKDPAKQALFEKLAEEGRGQAALIARSLAAPPKFTPGLRAALIKSLLNVSSPEALKSILAASKVRGLSVYGGPLRAGHVMPTALSEIGGRHRSAKGGTLRAAIFGVNDGILSNTSLLMGVAAAGVDAQTALLSGVAGLLAGAFSMAAGEFISVRTQREMFEHQIGQEREELALYPKEEAEELALIYAARGLPIEDARKVATTLVSDPKHALDVLAREELGLNPDDLGSPIGAALSSFAAFAAGASIPLAPFFLRASGAEWIAAGLASISLFAVGAAMSLFSGRHALMGGIRMVAIGILAAGATFLVGKAFGVAAA